jgi:hypothetical protein
MMNTVTLLTFSTCNSEAGTAAQEYALVNIPDGYAFMIVAEPL